MIAKPSYGIWVWRTGDIVIFSVIEDMTIGYAKKFYEYHQTFFGKHGTVFVFTNDYEITRGEMLKAADRFMHGNYIRYDVDMYNLIVKISEGLDKTTPTH
jgi:hypothetical protein